MAGSITPPMSQLGVTCSHHACGKKERKKQIDYQDRASHQRPKQHNLPTIASDHPVSHNIE
jgi:hypothetical protein